MQTLFRGGKVWSALGLILVLGAGCSSASKKKETVELDQLQGKKIALVSIAGEPTAQKIAEVSLINQLVNHGTFILIPKTEVEKARSDVDQDPTDWLGLAKRVGADLALRIQVDRFQAEEKSGYSTEEVEDTQLAEEMGNDGKTKRTFRIKALEGDVRYVMKFTNTEQKETTEGIAEAQDRVEVSAKTDAIRLPPRLRFLETLSNKAFQKFFEKQ